MEDNTSEFYSKKSTKIALVALVVVGLFLFATFYNGFNFDTGFIGGLK